MTKGHAEKELSRRAVTGVPAEYVVLLHNIGSLLRELRHKKGMGLKGVEAATGISRATLSNNENNVVDITATTMGRLMPAYGCPAGENPISWFFNELEKLQIPYISSPGRSSPPG